MLMRGLLQLFEGVLFCPLTKEGKGIRATGHLSYNRMQELMIDRLELLSCPEYQFDIHCLRSGGASAEA